MSKDTGLTSSQSAASKTTPARARQVTIDGVSYDLAELSKEVKQQLGNVRVVDQEIKRLQIQQSIARVARNIYVKAASAAVPKEATAPKDGARGIVINGVTHDWASLGARVQGLITGIRAADQELARLNSQLQMAQAARGAFAQGVKKNLPKPKTA